PPQSYSLPLHDALPICLAMIQADRYWPDLCKALGIQELEKNPKFATMAVRSKNSEELISILDKIFASKPRDEWMSILKNGGDFIDRKSTRLNSSHQINS